MNRWMLASMSPGLFRIYLSYYIWVKIGLACEQENSYHKRVLSQFPSPECPEDIALVANSGFCRCCCCSNSKKQLKLRRLLFVLYVLGELAGFTGIFTRFSAKTQSYAARVT